jgi:hypothetical protein
MTEKTIPALVKKPIHKSRTNQSIAALIALFLVNLVRQHFGFEFSPEVEGMINDQLIPAIMTGLGGLAMMFRQKAELIAPKVVEAVDAAAEATKTS